MIGGQGVEDLTVIIETTTTRLILFFRLQSAVVVPNEVADLIGHR
jgi:hypothetical protein